jgi:hypothetical protein
MISFNIRILGKTVLNTGTIKSKASPKVLYNKVSFKDRTLFKVFSNSFNKIVLERLL